MGFELMLNFNYPYTSRSLREFWSKWHISLSSWFRDYLYIPLGGSQVSYSRTSINLLAVFVISGLWHGAGWNFVLWGLMHGVFTVTERVTGINLGRPLTLLIVVLAWLPFRAPDFESLKLFLLAALEAPVSLYDLHLGTGPATLSFILALSAILPFYLMSEKKENTWLYFFAPILIFFFSSSSKSFIYFQF